MGSPDSSVNTRINIFNSGADHIANDAASTDDNAWPDRGRAIKPGKLMKRLTPSRISAGVDERYLDPPLFPVNTLRRFFDREGRPARPLLIWSKLPRFPWLETARSKSSRGHRAASERSYRRRKEQDKAGCYASVRSIDSTLHHRHAGPLGQPAPRRQVPLE